MVGPSAPPGLDVGGSPGCSTSGQSLHPRVHSRVGVLCQPDSRSFWLLLPVLALPLDAVLLPRHPGPPALHLLPGVPDRVGEWGLHGDWLGPLGRVCLTGQMECGCCQAGSGVWEWNGQAGPGLELGSQGSDNAGLGPGEEPQSTPQTSL